MTGMRTPPRGETTRPSIYRHGFEFVAERILHATRAGEPVTVLASREHGRVRYKRRVPDDSLLALANSPDYIGTYSDRDRIEFIEDELLHWMRSAP